MVLNLSTGKLLFSADSSQQLCGHCHSQLKERKYFTSAYDKYVLNLNKVTPPGGPWVLSRPSPWPILSLAEQGPWIAPRPTTDLVTLKIPLTLGYSGSLVVRSPERVPELVEKVDIETYPEDLA